MLPLKIFSTRNLALILFIWIILSTQSATGLTECGWIYRDGLLNPELAQFNATFGFTVIPVVNATKAWCIPVKNHSLTVDLGSVTNVTRLAVQGENGTENYTTSYEVDHSLDGQTFVNIKNGRKAECSAKEFFGAFPGLSTGSDIAESNLTIPFLAQYVRFRPQESVGNLCTRVDIYGCQSDEGFTVWSPWSPCEIAPGTPTECERRRFRTCEERNKGCRGPRNQTEGCDSNQCERECGELGIVEENRSVNDSAFTASTFKLGFEPYRARLNGPAAWCAQINDQNQFLEVDFNGEVEVKEIKTQGLQSGNNSAWVSLFFLDFRRSDNSSWEDYRENDSVRIYEGNENGSMIRTYVLSDKPTAQFIRFYPLNWTNMICMRVSVSGCRVSTPSSPVRGDKVEEVDEAFWIILWILLGLLLLLLLLGLLYLCCRFCPCCACCPCAAAKRKGQTADEAMMTELTSDEIDAPPVQVTTGATQTDIVPRSPETETQTLAVHLDSEDARSAVGTGAVFFTKSGEAYGTDIPGARYNEGFKSREYERATTSAASHHEAMMAGHSEVHAGRVAGTGMAREGMMKSQEESMRSSQYRKETTRSTAAGGRGEQYIGRYEVEALYPGQASLRRTPLGPPPTIELEVTPNYEDNSWRVDRIEDVDDRMAFGASAGGRARELEYRGVGYRGVEERTGATASVSGSREKELVYRGLDRREVDDGDRTIKVHLGDVPLLRLDASELESRAAHERYSTQDTYRARPRPDVETWRVNCIRGQAFTGTVNVDTSRGQVTGQPFHYHAPQSPTDSDISSFSQFNGSSVSEQFENNEARKEKFYKMFEYSRD